MSGDVAERIRQKNRAYYIANRERLRVAQAAYYRRNADAIRERVSRNRETHPEDPDAKRLRNRDWYRRKVETDPTYFARRRARRRAKEKGDADYDYIWFRDFGLCHICGEGVSREEAEFDHVVPLHRGGGHTNDNVKVSHGRCNRSKGTRLMAEVSI